MIRSWGHRKWAGEDAGRAVIDGQEEEAARVAWRRLIEGIPEWGRSVKIVIIQISILLHLIRSLLHFIRLLLHLTRSFYSPKSQI